LISALPRFILAVLISLVIAKPLELKIFEREINPELEVMQQETRARQESEVMSRFIPVLETIASNIQALKNEVFTKEQQRNELVRIAQEEADGTGGSMRKNLGPIYKVKKLDAERAEVELSQLRQRNNQRIVGLESKLAQTDADMNTALTTQLNEISSGLAGRLEVMSRLAKQSWAIWWANIFIILLFIIVETAPVMVKLLSPKGPYDNLLRIEEHRYSTTESEEVARKSADVRKQVSTLPDQENAFLSGSLDAELK
jgi:hypothetical protein